MIYVGFHNGSTIKVVACRSLGAAGVQPLLLAKNFVLWIRKNMIRL